MTLTAYASVTDFFNLFIGLVGNRLVSAVDEGVGQMVRVLEETGQFHRTLIVYTSDQGFAWGEHGFAWKVGPSDACLRMPA